MTRAIESSLIVMANPAMIDLPKSRASRDFDTGKTDEGLRSGLIVGQALVLPGQVGRKLKSVPHNREHVAHRVATNTQSVLRGSENPPGFSPNPGAGSPSRRSRHFGDIEIATGFAAAARPALCGSLCKACLTVWALVCRGI